jgi:hypothetical protein
VEQWLIDDPDALIGLLRERFHLSAAGHRRGPARTPGIAAAAVSASG